MNRREAALVAIGTCLSLICPPDSILRREDGEHVEIPDTGALIEWKDGAIESEPMLSPLSYDCTLTIEVGIAAYSGAQRDAAAAALALGLVAAREADQQLGGAIDGFAIGDPVYAVVAETVSEDGQQVILAPHHAASFPILLFFNAPSPLG